MGNNNLQPVFPGTENLVTVEQFLKAKKMHSAKKVYVHQFIRAGLIIPTYIGKNRNLFIDLEKYRKLKIRYIQKAEMQELLDKQQS